MLIQVLLLFTEDFASLRSLPNCGIYTCSDSAKMVAKETIKIKTQFLLVG